MAVLPPSLLFILGLVTTVCGYLDIYPPVNKNDTRTPLHFALLQSFSGEVNGSGSVAGLQVALDRINSDPTLLPGYSLHYTLTDSQCDRTVALDAFYNQITSAPVKIALIGSGCSVATEPTAENSHYYNITHISCVTSSTELVNRVRFRYYFQMLPTDAELAPTYFSVIRQYGWRRVGLIVQNENLFTVTMDRLKEMLDGINVTYDERTFETEGSIARLGALIMDSNIRIIIIATYAVHARSLLCEAYHSGLLYPRYLFLTYGWYDQNWWLVEDQNLSCTAQQRESVLSRSFAFLQFDFLEGRNLTTDTGITGRQYYDEEQNHLGVPPLYLQQFNYSQYCYDATWTLAYALNQTVNELEENSTLNSKVWEAAGLCSNGTFPLDYFSYNNSALLDVIFRHLEKTNFSGITGPVSFSDMGIRPVNRLRVMQYRNVTVNGSMELRSVEVALVLGMEEDHAFQYLPGESNESVWSVNGSTELRRVEVATVLGREEDQYAFQYFPGENDSTVWQGGPTPYDGVPSEIVMPVVLPITVIFCILAAAGIAFAVACLAFNFIFRNKKLVRLGSPNLNYLIGIGAIILYVGTSFFVIPTTDPQVVLALCNLTPWLTALGYSLCYGTILAKMFRVYYIFDNPTPKKKVLKDWHLALGVLTLVLVDLTILVVYTSVEGTQPATRVPNRENPRGVQGDLEIVTEYFTYVCSATARNIFLGVLYGYKMLLQVIAFVLAFSTRKVKVKGLDDAKYITAAVYITSIVLVVTIIATYTLNAFVNVYSALFCTGILIGTTIILGLVFVPKMVGLYQDPEGKTIFSSTDPSQSATTLTSDKDTIQLLRRQVQELKNEIRNLTSPSNPQTQTETSNTRVNEGLGGREGCKEGETVPTIWDTPNNSTAC